MNLSIHTMRKIGARIRTLRKRNKLTQERLAELSGYSTGYIGSVENARKVPSISFIFDVAEALETSASELLIDTDKSVDREKLKKKIKELVDKL